MARMLAIVALLLGLGLTAYESFSEPEVASGTETVRAMEGGSPWPSPEPK
jgi:hypothetical protein